jgi:hypothetical protein
VVDGRDEKGRFVEGYEGGPGGPPGHQKNYKHGVAAAMKDLAAGQPLRGNLAAIQHRYAVQVGTHEGRIEAQQWLAGAFFAIVEGLLAVVQNAIEEGEQEKAVAYIRNFGTFGSKAGAELSRLEELAGERSQQALDYDALVQELQGKGKSDA